jgi:hypothetical protein
MHFMGSYLQDEVASLSAYSWKGGMALVLQVGFQRFEFHMNAIFSRDNRSFQTSQATP